MDVSMDDARRNGATYYATTTDTATAARASMAEKSRRHLYGADVDAHAELLLRHRLFPRAMAWNATQQQVTQAVAAPTEPLHQPPSQRIDSRQHFAPRQQQHTSLGDASPIPMAAARALARQQHQLQESTHHSRQSSLDVTGSCTAQLSAFHLDDPQSTFTAPAQRPPPSMSLDGHVPAKAIHEALSFARSYPLLHAANGIAATELRRQKENWSRQSNTSDDSRHSFDSATQQLPQQRASSQREKLFQTMGKWFDTSSNSGSGSSSHHGSSIHSTTNGYGSFASSNGSTALVDDSTNSNASLLQHIPRRTAFDRIPPPVPVAAASTVHLAPLPLAFVSSTTQSFPSISDNAAPPRAASFSYPTSPSSSSFNAPSPTHSTSNWSIASEPHQRDRRSPAASGVAHKKRQRGSHTPAPSLAKALLTGCGAKQCSFADCSKIAVSKGLCRGHGGGRRCQFAGCTKCAQSRSPFCWAHGGGKRCEAPNCRRSRKTKHYCVDHVELEGSSAALLLLLPTGSSGNGGGSASPADSDESMDSAIGYATTSAPAPLSPLGRRPDDDTNAAAAAAAGRHRAAQLAAQLPSLNDALKRSLPLRDDAFDVAATSEHMFHLQRHYLQPQQQQQQTVSYVQTFNLDIRR